jgi:hypothetical protein
MGLTSTLSTQGNYEPFQETRMNGLESLSLFTTQVTLLGFGFFLPAGVQTSHVFKLILTVLLVTMNGLVVLYFLFHLLRVARALLVSVNVSFDGMLGCLHKVRREQRSVAWRNVQKYNPFLVLSDTWCLQSGGGISRELTSTPWLRACRLRAASSAEPVPCVAAAWTRCCLKARPCH